MILSHGSCPGGRVVTVVVVHSVLIIEEKMVTGARRALVTCHP